MNLLTVIYLVRHAEVKNPHDIFYGRLPGFRLSSRGTDQAQSAAKALKNKNITVMYSSPLLQSRQTANIIRSRHNGLALHITELLTCYLKYWASLLLPKVNKSLIKQVWTTAILLLRQSQN